MARAVEAAAAERNAPLAELKTLVEGLTERPPPDPFTGQDAHEARRAQAELAARMADHQRGIVEVHRLAFTTRQAQAGLDEAHRASHRSMAQLAENQAAAAAELAEMREQLKRQARRFANTFRAGASSSSASEPGAEE
jgi:glutathione S-transferase